VSDAQNALRWEWPLEEAFGANGPNENPSGLGAFAFNLRFPGQYFDAETGMHYSYRDYDPAIGRYVQSDPIGLGGGVNTFSYAGQRPILSADPYGLFEILWKANSFEEYTKRPGWVRALEDYKQRLQAKINALCEGDRQEMQLYFDGWKVGFLAQETDPTTSYRTKTTT